MVERHHRIDFAEGALVFPGGKVDAADADPTLRPRCRGTPGLDDDAITLRVAAIRETFEECGVLLARRAAEPSLLSAEELRPLETRYRDRLQADETTMAELAGAENLELACDLLVPFAHWITPESMPKRFDTHFFLVAAPEDQAAAHDGSESVDSVWTTPDAAVLEARAGRRTIIFPTLLNLKKLGRSDRTDEALERARGEPVVTVLPRPERGPEGSFVHIPAEAGYGITRTRVG